MRRTRLMTVLLLISGLAASPQVLAQRADKAASMLEAATQAELVDGNLDTAIKLYQQILTSFSAERPVAAAALLGLGRCYEQLGQPKAREIYERLINQYGERSKEVSAARARLARLAEQSREHDEGSEVVVREIFDRRAPSVSSGQGTTNFAIFSDLAVHNGETGETRRLLGGARSAAYPVLSPVGPPNRRQVAYVSWSGDLQASLKQAQENRAGQRARIELRVVGIDGSNDRAVLSSRDWQWLRPLAWSPEGDRILADIERRDGTHDIALVTVEDGAVQVVKSLQSSSPQEAGFSPDGRFIAYHLPSPRDSRRLDLHVVSLDESAGRSRREQRYSLTLGSEVPTVSPAQQQTLHVLNRLSFGPRPGDVENVSAMGIEAYIERQLSPERISDPVVESKLAGFTSLKMSLAEATEHGGPVAPQALRARSIFEKRAMADRALENKRRAAEDNTVMPTSDETRRVLLAGHPEPDEIHQARIIRALYSERQLFELIVDFWMNHFSIRHRDHPQTPHFEEQVIRRNALGKFDELLMAVAKHPRMLNYLDNWRSSAPAEVMQKRLAALRPTLSDEQYLQLMARKPFLDQAKGLNENYARELMELHTLGVDGGYTQKDVIEVAKVLTGWTIRTEGLVNGLDDEGVFGFDPLLHVEGEKVVLGKTIPSGGVEEGEQVIRLLAQHPSTARFIATKLARRFVADDPPADVIAAASRTFQQTGGDIRAVLRTIFKSPQFRSPEAYRAKIKKPIELIVSSLRAVNAEVVDDVAYDRVALSIGANNPSFLVQMGERLYDYEAPDGNPDVSPAWMNSNALLVRLDFANTLATGRLPGLKINLAAGQRLLDQLGLPRPTPQQIQNTRTLMQASAKTSTAAMRQQDSMMMMGGAGAPRDRDADIDPAAIVVAAMLGSPQFQKR
jgi:uncharacterized protein (DUF1800 family)